MTGRELLIRTAVSLKGQARAVLRARIVLAAADGLSNGATARGRLPGRTDSGWSGPMVLSIDEKTAIAARSRRHPGRPASPGHPAREEFEHRRHGTASLVAASDVRTGEVLTEIIARNDAVTFTASLDQLDAVIAPGQHIHVALDRALDPAARLLAQPGGTVLLRPDPPGAAVRRLLQPR